VLLAGDVGGTKTALALLEAREGGPAMIREAALASRDFASLEAAIDRFLGPGARPPIEAACFGVAGPVVDGRSEVTNLPWVVDETALAGAIPARRVRLLNDLAATAHGVLALPASAFAVLRAGVPRPGNMALIAAGTGLGEALMIWDGVCHHVVANEGGHTDFGPRTDLEIELLRFLQREHEHVSYERILSGPGLFNIYRFLRERDGGEPRWLGERLAREDPGAAITEVALAGGHPLCVGALDLFVAIYGAEAGNLALKALALGGVVVGGGIGPRIRAKLEGGAFVAAFDAKGRFSSVLDSIPLRLALEPRAALLGAGRVAASL
jgi:glucokinase